MNALANEKQMEGSTSKGNVMMKTYSGASNNRQTGLTSSLYLPTSSPYIIKGNGTRCDWLAAKSVLNVHVGRERVRKIVRESVRV